MKSQRVLKVLYRPCLTTNFSWQIKEILVEKRATNNIEVLEVFELVSARNISRRKAHDKNITRMRKIKSTGLFSSNRDSELRAKVVRKKRIQHQSP